MKLCLSLGGGGVRGYFQAILLKYLKQYVHFDLIVGVSIGALNGLLVSQNDDPTAFYTKDIINDIYDDSLMDRVLDVVQLKPVYDGINKRKYIEKYAKIRTINQSPIPLAAVTYNYSARYPKVFKSWLDKNSIVDVLDASSAPPVYFPAVTINDQFYIDGGVVANNPCLIAMECAHQLFNEDYRILNIGCGNIPCLREDRDVRQWGIQWIYNGLFDISIDASSQNSNEVARELLKDRFLDIDDARLSCIKHNDKSEDALCKLKEYANQYWLHSKDKILAWLKK